MTVHNLSAQWLSAVGSLSGEGAVPSRHQPDVFSGFHTAGHTVHKRKNYWGIRTTWPYVNAGLQETTLTWASVGAGGLFTASFCRTGMPALAQWRMHGGYGKWLTDQWMMMVQTRCLVTTGSGFLASADLDARLKLLYKPDNQVVVGLQVDGLNTFFRPRESRSNLTMEATVGLDVNPSAFVFASIRKNAESVISGQWGCQYRMHARAAIRSSIQWQPFMVSSMFLFQLNTGFRLGVESSFHPVLGVSPGIQLHFL
ncbi:MAG: hypothetical protein ACKO5C_06440 [Ferruginibacter sp.]